MKVNYMLAELNPNLGKVVLPLVIAVVFLGVLFIIWAMVKRYKRIRPNEIGVIYGKRRTQTISPDGQQAEVGFKIVTGGGVFILPIVEDYASMSTEAFQIEIAEDDIPTKKNVGVHVAGVATCRISQMPQEQVNAVQNFLGKPLDEMKNMIAEILRGHLRSIVGSLEVEELLRERSKFNEAVLKECSEELSRMGIKILTLVIQDVRDKEGYIEALGKQAVAGAKRDANIATAEAERETLVKTSDAKRTAAEAVAQNDAKIKLAEKNRDIQVAEFKLETATKQAAADIAGQLAETEQKKKLVVLQAQVQSEAAREQAKVQELEAIRKQKELEATVIVTAEANAKAAAITATGKRNAEQIEAETRSNVSRLNAQTARQNAEGAKDAAILEGQGEAQRLQAIAEAQAVSTQKTKQAEAEGDKAKLLATAAGREAELLAVAAGERAKLLAQAEGNLKLAEALKALSEEGKLMFVLDRLPVLLDHAGDAGEKVMKAIFDPVAAGVGKIGNVTITDLGNGGTAKSGMGAMGQIVPQIVMDFFAQAKARGIDLSELLKLLKMDPAKLAEMVGPFAAAVVPAQGVTPAGDKQ